MLSQGLIVAPLYHYTSQVGPRFGDSGSLKKWKWCHNIMFEANIHLRPLHPSILDKYKVLKPLVCCLKGLWLHPYTVTPAKLPPDLGSQVHLGVEMLPYIMVEANIHLRLLYTSILDTSKVFEPLVCCLKGIWVHPYTITLSEPQIWEVRVTCGVKMMPYCHGWGWYRRTFDCNCFMQVPMQPFNTKRYFLTTSKYGIPTCLSS